MDQIRHVEPNEDPVCGMQVDPEAAKARGLALTHDGHDYVFCGKGCMLDFRDEPGKCLDPRHLPSM
jgi:YHS domain-containing protein